MKFIDQFPNLINFSYKLLLPFNGLDANKLILILTPFIRCDAMEENRGPNIVCHNLRSSPGRLF